MSERASLENLSARLVRLERSNRRLKLGTSSLGVLLGAVLLCGQDGKPSGDFTEIKARTLRVETVLVVDETGEARGKLSATQKTGAQLRLDGPLLAGRKTVTGRDKASVWLGNGTVSSVDFVGERFAVGEGEAVAAEMGYDRDKNRGRLAVYGQPGHSDADDQVTITTSPPRLGVGRGSDGARCGVVLAADPDKGTARLDLANSPRAATAEKPAPPLVPVRLWIDADGYGHIEATPPPK